MNVEKLPISLVVITLNEEKNIKRCLASCGFVSDIIVLDSYSKDKTKEIAQAFGARFIEQEWLGFGLQKKKAVELAKFDWVLCIDADEEVTSELKKELFLRWKTLDEKTSYKIPRLSFHMQRWIHHGGWYPDYQLRLFHRKYAQWSEDPIHEKVIANQVDKFQEPIAHYVFSNIADQVRTNDKYSTLQAQKMDQEGKSFNLFHMLTKPMVKFIECYFLKLGFLDGLPGFVIAISAGYSVFLKWAKLWELKLSGAKNEK